MNNGATIKFAVDRKRVRIDQVCRPSLRMQASAARAALIALAVHGAHWS